MTLDITYIKLCMNGLTFELWYFTSGSFRKAFVAGVTGQSYSNATTAQEKADLLTSCILIHTHRNRLRPANIHHQYSSKIHCREGDGLLITDSTLRNDVYP